jgi:hypothetical protein
MQAPLAFVRIINMLSTAKIDILVEYKKIIRIKLGKYVSI